MKFTWIGIAFTSLVAMLLPIVTVSAASSQIEIISIDETSGNSVEIMFNSKIPKSQLIHFTINASPDLSRITQSNNLIGQQIKPVSKILKKKVSGLIQYELKPINLTVPHKFKICAKGFKGKVICSEQWEHTSLTYLSTQISNLPSDWGNPKPIQLPIPVVTAAPVPAPASKVAITQASVGTAPGVAFTTQPQVTVQDSSGNTITSSSALVTATISTGGTLVGTATATASSGIATFSNLGIRGFGGTAYTITYTSSGLTTATQSVTPSALTVNATAPGGGKIFYVAPTSAGFDCGPSLNERCFYLEAAPTTGTNAWINSQINWSGNVTTLIGVTAQRTAIGAGYANSLAMVEQIDGGNTSNKAGTKARDYRGPNNLSDWYLPSLDELNEFYSQRVIIGDFVGGCYFSSTEVAFNSARYQWFSDADFFQGTTSKTSSCRTRATRAF